jgi:hypothetical protein
VNEPGWPVANCAEFALVIAGALELAVLLIDGVAQTVPGHPSALAPAAGSRASQSAPVEATTRVPEPIRRIDFRARR